MSTGLRMGEAVATVPATWLRGPANYENGWIVLDRERAREYQPFGERDLLLDLATVRSTYEATAFVQRYGLLRHGSGSKEFRERFADWDAEASRLRVILNLYLTLRQALEGDAEALDRLREVWEPAPGETSPAAIPSDQQILVSTSSLIGQRISERLLGAKEGFMTRRDEDGRLKPGEFHFFIALPDLLTMAYYELGRVLSGRVPLATCAECGRAFEVKDRRQKYCSKTCGSRARYRRWSEKRRLEGEGTE